MTHSMTKYVVLKRTEIFNLESCSDGQENSLANGTDSSKWKKRKYQVGFKPSKESTNASVVSHSIPYTDVSAPC